MENNYPKCCSWLEIDGKQLQRNLQALKEIISSSTEIGVVLKSNAYGFGLLNVYRALVNYADVFHVYYPQDALLIRDYERKMELGRSRLIVMGPIDADDIVSMVTNDIEFVISDNRLLRFQAESKYIGGINKQPKIHIFIDSGLGREGFTLSCEDIEYLKMISQSFNIIGIMTHYSEAEGLNNLDYSISQRDTFEKKASQVLNALGLKRELIEFHTSASAPTVVFHRWQYDAVRLGLSMYGMWTSNETRDAYSQICKGQEIELALKWKCKPQMVKKIKQGDSVGYNRSYISDKDRVIAILPIGYYDGYPYFKDKNAYVLIKDQKCSVLGCVMMNCLVVDITNVAGLFSDPYDLTAILLGRDEQNIITAEILASWGNTINYHVVTSISNHLRRVVLFD